ncbi:hypothetical protein ACPCHT_01290 [Nucisporomicrobium flavum]|uniref:hypothetical protein n=1 Tax=Nucisporomicrobium flavum TaxID=2785915 RepID=UPI003C2B193C
MVSTPSVSLAALRCPYRHGRPFPAPHAGVLQVTVRPWHGLAPRRSVSRGGYPQPRPARRRGFPGRSPLSWRFSRGQARARRHLGRRGR